MRRHRETQLMWLEDLSVCSPPGHGGAGPLWPWWQQWVAAKATVATVATAAPHPRSSPAGSGPASALGQWGGGGGVLPDEAPPPSRFAGRGCARASTSTDPETAPPSAAAAGCVGLGVEETCGPCSGRAPGGGGQGPGVGGSLWATMGPVDTWAGLRCSEVGKSAQLSVTCL